MISKSWSTDSLSWFKCHTAIRLGLVLMTVILWIDLIGTHKLSVKLFYKLYIASEVNSSIHLLLFLELLIDLFYM